MRVDEKGQEEWREHEEVNRSNMFLETDYRYRQKCQHEEKKQLNR